MKAWIMLAHGAVLSAALAAGPVSAAGPEDAEIADIQDSPPGAISDVKPETFIFTEPVRGSDIPVDLTLLETVDGLYTAIGVRKPVGPGPFPIVLMFTGNGGGGIPWVRHRANNRGYTMERFLEAGYAVAWLRYRAEVWFEYTRVPQLEVKRHLEHQMLNRPPLEYDDLQTIVGYVKSLDYVDGDRVALIGNSHGGGMILKATAEMDVAAAVVSEPDASEFLQMEPSVFGPKANFPTMASVAQYLDKDVAMKRIARITTPLLFLSRDHDHLKGIFETSYAWMEEAGKDVRWITFDHDLHGYIFPHRQPDGEYHSNEHQLNAIQAALDFFDRRLKSTKAKDGNGNNSTGE